MRVTVSSKGQIVIPAELRRRHDIKPGDQLVVVDLAGQISLHPVPDDPVAAARGAFKDVPGLSSEEFLAERGPNFKYEPLIGDRKPALDYRK